MVALVDGVNPRTLSLRQVLNHYLDHQREVVTRRTKDELERAERRAHVLEGYLIALDNLDEVIAVIRGSDDADTARSELMTRFGLTEIQAQAILDMRLRALTGLERKKIKDEHDDLMERIGELRAILADESRLMALIREELLEIKEAFADDRRTEIVPAEGEIDLEQLIAEEDMVISITASGYIKRIALSAYRTQGRGGVGVIGMDMKEDDYIEHLFVASTHDYLLFFTTVGKVYRVKVHELPAGQSPVQGPGAGERAAAAPGRVRARGDRHPRLQRGQVPAVRHPQGHRQEDRVQVLRHHPQGRRHHRAEGARGRRAGRRAPDRRRRRRADGVAQRLGGALLRARCARRWAAIPPAWPA